MVDWTKPIEAVHEDGRVQSVKLVRDDLNVMPMNVAPALEDDTGVAAWFYRDGTRKAGGWRIRNVKEEAVMETKFKVGDRVRHPVHGDGTIAFDDGKNGWNLRVNLDSADDEGWTEYWVNADGRSSSYCDDQIVTLVANPDELTALRAFKAMALERYPNLEPKPETDWEAANRFEREYYQDRHGDMADMIFAAIAWARANPRNTETKEG